MCQVLLAEPPGSQSVGSFGHARNMLIRQLNFPLVVNDEDKHHAADSDRLWMQDRHYQRQLDYYVARGHGDGAFADIIPRWTSERFLQFCRDVLKMPDATGCRITGTVNQWNGHAIWTIEAFQNVSGVEVFTGGHDNSGDSRRFAPNIQGVYKTNTYGESQFCSLRDYQ